MVGPLNLSVELRRARFDIDLADALVLDVPVVFGLKLATVIGSDFTDAEGKIFNDIVHEKDGTDLGMALVDFEGADAGSNIKSCVLISFDRFVVFALECQELKINLDLLARHLLLMPR